MSLRGSGSPSLWSRLKVSLLKPVFTSSILFCRSCQGAVADASRLLFVRQNIERNKLLHLTAPLVPGHPFGLRQSLTPSKANTVECPNCYARVGRISHFPEHQPLKDASQVDPLDGPQVLFNSSKVGIGITSLISGTTQILKASAWINLSATELMLTAIPVVDLVSNADGRDVTRFSLTRTETGLYRWSFESSGLSRFYPPASARPKVPSSAPAAPPIQTTPETRGFFDVRSGTRVEGNDGPSDAHESLMATEDEFELEIDADHHTENMQLYHEDFRGTVLKFKVLQHLTQFQFFIYEKLIHLVLGMRPESLLHPALSAAAVRFAHWHPLGPRYAHEILSTSPPAHLPELAAMVSSFVAAVCGASPYSLYTADPQRYILASLQLVPSNAAYTDALRQRLQGMLPAILQSLCTWPNAAAAMAVLEEISKTGVRLTSEQVFDMAPLLLHLDLNTTLELTLLSDFEPYYCKANPAYPHIQQAIRSGTRRRRAVQLAGIPIVIQSLQANHLASRTHPFLQSLEANGIPVYDGNEVQILKSLTYVFAAGFDEEFVKVLNKCVEVEKTHPAVGLMLNVARRARFNELHRQWLLEEAGYEGERMGEKNSTSSDVLFSRRGSGTTTDEERLAGLAAAAAQPPVLPDDGDRRKGKGSAKVASRVSNPQSSTNSVGTKGKNKPRKKKSKAKSKSQLVHHPQRAAKQDEPLSLDNVSAQAPAITPLLYSSLQSSPIASAQEYFAIYVRQNNPRLRSPAMALTKLLLFVDEPGFDYMVEFEVVKSDFENSAFKRVSMLRDALTIVLARLRSEARYSAMHSLYTTTMALLGSHGETLPSSPSHRMITQAFLEEGRVEEAVQFARSLATLDVAKRSFAAIFAHFHKYNMLTEGAALWQAEEARSIYPCTTIDEGGKVDLHQLTSAESYFCVLALLHHAKKHKLRSLTIITGRGHNSRNRTPVLQPFVQELLLHEEEKAVLDGVQLRSAARKGFFEVFLSYPGDSASARSSAGLQARAVRSDAPIKRAAARRRRVNSNHVDTREGNGSLYKGAQHEDAARGRKIVTKFKTP